MLWPFNAFGLRRLPGLLRGLCRLNYQGSERHPGDHEQPPGMKHKWEREQHEKEEPENAILLASHSWRKPLTGGFSRLLFLGGDRCCSWNLATLCSQVLHGRSLDHNGQTFESRTKEVLTSGTGSYDVCRPSTLETSLRDIRPAH